MDKKDTRNLLTLFFLSVISFFSTIWIREADLMEQRNFITAREMLINKSYFVTTLNGNLRFEKPPFPTWLTTIVMKISNNSYDEWLLRIPSALTGILLVFLIYFFVKEFTKDSTKAFLSSFVTATMFMLIKISSENTWDIYTYVFSFAAILTLYLGLKSSKLRYFILTGIFLSISIMSKGPVGIYGLFIPFILAYISIFGIKEFKKSWKKISITLGITIFLSSIWPIAMYIKYPHYFLEIINKEENTWSTKHIQGPFFYLDYFVYTGVWIFFAVVTWIKKIKNKKFHSDKYRKFLILWNLMIIIFLSIIQMKKKRYGIPIYIVASLNIGLLCNYYFTTLWSQLKSWEKKFLYFQNGFLMFVSFGLISIFTFNTLTKKNLSLYYCVASIIVYALFIYFIFNTLKNHKNHVGKFTVLTSGILMIWINLNANWVIDKNFVNKEIKSSYTNSKYLRKNPPSLDIYSTNYDVHNIWDMGKEIKNLNSSKTLPNKFIVLGNIPSNISKNYIVAKNETYSEKNGDLINLYYLNKKER